MKRPGKRVTVLVRRSPLNSGKAGEAIRMALGLEIKDHRVTVIFLDEGVFATVQELDPALTGCEPWSECAEMLHVLGHRLWVEEESLDRLALDRGRLDPRVEVVPRGRILMELTESDAAVSL